MTTSSAEGYPVLSLAYPYTPASLVYTDEQWADISLADAPAKVRDFIEADRPSAAVRRGREALCRRLGPRSAAALDMDSAADWLVDNAY
eukprot:2133297-Alexandrium_andersonii.AAC.1